MVSGYEDRYYELLVAVDDFLKWFRELNEMELGILYYTAPPSELQRLLDLTE